MKTTNVEYPAKNCLSKGFLAYDNNRTEKRPGVLVAHTWWGCNQFVKDRAIELGNLGYVALAIDLYGDGKVAANPEEAASLMMPLFLDRKLLQDRLLSAFEFLKAHPLVDSDKIGAIGFCFGGLSVIELLRTGSNIAAVVSFHGVLGDAMGQMHATAGIRNKKINGSLLVLHGHNDPLVSSDDIANLEKEMTKNGADWQINIYGNTSHAFMNEEMQDPENGLVYNPKTAKRAWLSMINFFKEIFG